MQIGFVGLGHMGQPMVRNLANAGYELLAYDISPQAMEAVKEHAQCVNQLSDIAKADVIFTMLQTGQQVHDVCLAEDGLFNAKPGTLFIDTSSIDVDTCRQLHQAASDRQLKFLDAPVSGGVAGAKNASLTIMVGGEHDIFESARPILNQLGQNIIHVGSAGNGQVAKICNNMILGISMIAISEAFHLGEQLGLAPEKLFQVAAHSSGQCWALTSYCPAPGLVENVPSNNDYQPGFSANMMLKDLNLSQNAANSVGYHTPLGEQATQIYNQFVTTGNGQVDFSGIIKLLSPS